MAEKHTVTLTTGAGIISFPRLYASTAAKKEDGTLSYEAQILIPKKDRAAVRDIMKAIKEVGEAKWGANWKKVRNPLRDGDIEADELTDDGKTKGEKYPERLGCYFLNARSHLPVGVYDRSRTPIPESKASQEIYGGISGKLNITFYAYAKAGNSGIGVGLNGVQKLGDGEAFGAGRPSVESMFDMLDDEDDDLDEDEFDEFDETEEVEEVEEVEEKPKRRATKKTAAKKTAAKKTSSKKSKPPVEDEDDDLYDDLDDEDA